VESSTVKTPIVPQIKYEIEMRYRPSILDNIKYWKVFDDDEKIKKFIEVIVEFENIHVYSDDEEEYDPMTEGEIHNTSRFSEYMAEHKFLQLKNNFIPKGLMPMEHHFDRNDVPVKTTVLPKDDNIEECNIGVEEDPKYIKLSKEIHFSIRKNTYNYSKNTWMFFPGSLRT
jgi:hypothetical protein